MRLTNEELIQIIKEELEAVIDEKKGKKRKAAKKKRRKKKKKKKAKRDACYNKVKSRYDVWPSAYASGALVKCRKVGAANWGNSKKEGLNEATKDDLDKYTADDFAEWYAQVQKYLAAEIKSGLFDPKKEEGGAYRSYVDGYTTSTYEEEWLASKGLLEEFKPHDMYDPETGEKHDAEVEADHVDMAGKGFVHVDPKKIEKILRDEGGAAGMDPFLKEFGDDMEEEILKALEEMPSVAQHEDGDYILDDDKEVDLQEVVPRTGIYAVKQSNIDFAKKIEARYREAGLTKKADLFKRAIDKAVAGEINLEQFHKMLDSAKTLQEAESFSVDKKFMTKYLKLKGYKNLEGKDIEQLYTQSLASRGINAPTAKDREKMKGLQEAKNCGCGQDPCKTYGKQ